MEPPARLKTATLQLSTQIWRATPPKYSKARWWQNRKCSRVSASVNSRYILRLKASTMMKKESRRRVLPTGTEPGAPPIDLRAFSGLEVEGEESGPGFGAHLFYKALRME
jgi:hypothetical protein